jgi:hypothetical protein
LYEPVQTIYPNAGLLAVMQNIADLGRKPSPFPARVARVVPSKRLPDQFHYNSRRTP